jgi:hypothetical protein
MYIFVFNHSFFTIKALLEGHWPNTLQSKSGSGTFYKATLHLSSIS